MRNTIVTLGILTALVPFLGFPGAIENIFFVFVGLSVATIAYYDNINVERYKVSNNKVVHNIENNNKIKDITKKEIHNDNV